MRFYLALAALCGCTMSLQILQSRLFSVVTWYHLSFLIISIAMFGLTLGAIKIYRQNADDMRRNLPALTSRLTFLFAVSILFSILVQMLLPIVHTHLMSVLVTLPLVAWATAIPYYYAGQVITLCLTRSNFPVGHVYAADLLGASAGCLIALLLMQTLDAPSALIAISGIAVLCASLFNPQQKKKQVLIHIISAFFLLAIAAVNTSLAKPFIYPVWTKGTLMTQNEIKFEKWNAISRVTVTGSLPDRPVFIWGPSPKLPPDTSAEYQYLAIDGDASTPITKFDGKSWDQLKYLEYDVTNLAYFLPGLESGAVIGVGGGRDLLSARYFGIKKSVALDVNATQINLLTKNETFRNYTNLYNQPDTRIINSEARSWLTRSGETFDIIQMSMIDTWASTGAGAFALSENSLYTENAFRIFLEKLNPGGVLTVSRWYTPESYNDTGRLISMSIAALLDMGVKNPAAHIYIAQSARVSTLILGRDALTSSQIAALNGTVEKYGYNVLAAPDHIPEHPVLKSIYSAQDEGQLQAALKDIPFDLSPPTDMRPFFFNQTHILHPLQVLKQAMSVSIQSANAKGHAIATLNLYLIIFFSIILAAVLLIPSLRNTATTLKSSFVANGTAYFIMIGVGFMFIEITLMQIMSMFLGHPVYGLGIVLFSLILSTGIGSAVSEKFPLRSSRGILIWASCIFVYTALLSLQIESILNSLIYAEFVIRVCICLGLIMPLGILLGYGFPSGIRLVQNTSSEMTTWFWAVNGAAGVVASALAILISIGFGLDTTLLLAGIMYWLLAIPALALMRASRAGA